MKEVDITIDSFYSLKPLKKEEVRKRGLYVYKYSPLTEPIINRLYYQADADVLQHFSTPIAKLRCKNNYFGYIMYFRRLKHINEAIKKKKIDNIGNYLIELIEIIDELNKLDLTYWDFHSNNVLVDKKGHPFLLDIDDIEYKATKELLYKQIEYLIEFILNMMLKNSYSLYKILKIEALEGIINNNLLNYIKNIFNQLPDQSLTLPYKLVEELNDKDKVHAIQLRIK